MRKICFQSRLCLIDCVVLKHNDAVDLFHSSHIGKKWSFWLLGIGTNWVNVLLEFTLAHRKGSATLNGTEPPEMLWITTVYLPFHVHMAAIRKSIEKKDVWVRGDACRESAAVMSPVVWVKNTVLKSWVCLFLFCFIFLSFFCLYLFLSQKWPYLEKRWRLQTCLASSDIWFSPNEFHHNLPNEKPYSNINSLGNCLLFFLKRIK